MKNGIIYPIHTPYCAKTSKNTTQWICIGSLYKAIQKFKCKNVCQNENHPYLIVLLLLFFRTNPLKYTTNIKSESKKLCQNNKLFTNGKGFERCKNINEQYTWKNPAGLKTHPHFAHLCSQITHENTIICNVLRVFSMLSASRSGIRNKITLAVVSLRTFTTFTHPTLCTLCVQWFAKTVYTHFACCVVCAFVMPSANTCWLSGIGRFLFALPGHQLIKNRNKHFNNHQHRPSFKAPESYHPHSITIIHQTSSLSLSLM